MARTEDTRDTGIPTRAIHQSYLSMQQAHREWRQVRDDLSATGEQEQERKRQYQDAVLTYYEFLRPHLIHESGLSDYWNGSLPGYDENWQFNRTREAVAYVQEEGTGVYQVQKHTTVAQVRQEVLGDGGLETFEGWHEFLGLSWDSERLVAVDPEAVEDEYTHTATVLRVAVLPLRELDHWRAYEVQERTAGDGFMAGQTDTQVRQRFEPTQKLTAAKRLLVEATDKLGLLSHVDFTEPREAGGKYADALDPDVSPEDLDNR